MMFSSISFAGWTKVSETYGGDKMYLDYDRIREHDGDFYVWFLIDAIKPTEGIFSVVHYRQVDCNIFRYKDLDFSAYTYPMGNGTAKYTDQPQENWAYPSPDSLIESALNSICSR